MFYLGIGTLNFKKFGSWAVVTGCTDGIGKAYVDQLAKQGMNLVLISRSADKLKDQEKKLQEKFPSLKIQVIAADFTGLFTFIFSIIDYLCFL